MASGADFYVHGDATLDASGMQKGLDQIGSSGQQLINGLGAKTIAAGNLISGVVEKAVSKAIELGAELVSTGVSYNAQIEQYSVALTTLLGDATAAQTALENIKEDAARTPFDTAGLVQANEFLIAAGENAAYSRAAINALGDAVSATGGGNDELTRMAQNLQQIANAGEATAADIKQFAYAGIDVYGLLADYTGKSTAEVKDMTVTYQDLTAALIQASEEGGRYYGAMDAQSQTLNGRIATLTDNATQLAGALTEGLVDGEKDLIEAAIDWVDTLSTTLQEEGPGAMLEAGYEILLDFLSGVASALPDVVNTGIQTVTDFITGLLNRAPEIAETGGEIVGKLIAGILSMLTQLVSSAVQLAETFALQFLTFEWLDVGISIVKGIIDGFVQALPNLITTIVENVKNIGKAAQNAAESASDNLVVKITEPTYTKTKGKVYTEAEQLQAAHARRSSSSSSEEDAGSSIILDPVKKTTTKSTTKKEKTVAEQAAEAFKALGDAYKYSGDAAQEQADRLAVLQAAYDTAQTNVEKYKTLLNQSVSSSGAASEMSQYLAEQLEKEESEVEKAKEALDEYKDSLDETKQAAKKLEAAHKDLNEAWSNSAVKTLKTLADDVKNLDLGGVLTDVWDLAKRQLDTATKQSLVDMAQGWLDTLETAFAADGLSGLVKTGSSIAEAIGSGMTDSDSAVGSLVSGILSQLGISGGLDGLISAITSLAPQVLGLVALVALVGAAFAGVASVLDAAAAASEEFQTALKNTVFRVMDAIEAAKERLYEIVAPLVEALIPIVEDIGDLLIALIDLGTTLIAGVLKAVLPIVEALLTILDPFIQLLASIAELVATVLAPAFEVLATVINWLLTPVKWVAEAIRSILNGIISLINRVLEALNSIEIFGWHPFNFNTVSSVDDTSDTSSSSSSSGSGDYSSISSSIKSYIDEYKNGTSSSSSSSDDSDEKTHNRIYEAAQPVDTVDRYAALLQEARASAALNAQQTLQSITRGNSASTGTAETLANALASLAKNATITVPVTLDGQEIARVTAPYLDEELSFKAAVEGLLTALRGQ